MSYGHISSFIYFMYGEVRSMLFYFQNPQQSNSNIDPFNMSNDEFYNPKLLDTALRSNMGVNLIQVSVQILHLVKLVDIFKTDILYYYVYMYYMMHTHMCFARGIFMYRMILH